MANRPKLVISEGFIKQQYIYQLINLPEPEKVWFLANPNTQIGNQRRILEIRLRSAWRLQQDGLQFCTQEVLCTNNPETSVVVLTRQNRISNSMTSIVCVYDLYETRPSPYIQIRSFQEAFEVTKMSAQQRSLWIKFNTNLQGSKQRVEVQISLENLKQLFDAFIRKQATQSQRIVVEQLASLRRVIVFSRRMESRLVQRVFACLKIHQLQQHLLRQDAELMTLTILQEKGKKILKRCFVSWHRLIQSRTNKY